MQLIFPITSFLAVLYYSGVEAQRSAQYFVPSSPVRQSFVPTPYHRTSPFAVVDHAPKQRKTPISSTNDASLDDHHQHYRHTFGNKTKDLHMLYLYTKDGSPHASGMLPAVMLAEMLINRRNDLLPNYNLVIDKVWTHFEDTHEPAVTARALQKALNTANYTYVGILGPGWSTEAAAAANVARDNNLIDMSGAATGPTLNNDAGEFPTFFRTITSDGDFVTAQVALLKSLGYGTVLATFQQDGFFQTFMNDIESKVKSAGISVGMSDGFSDAEDEKKNAINGFSFTRQHRKSPGGFMDVTVQKILSMKQVPVILSVFGGMAGRDLVCEAYKQGITSRTHIWIVTAPTTMGWWNVPAFVPHPIVTHTDNAPYSCYPEELEDALIGSFWLTYHGEVNRTSDPTHRQHIDMYMATLQAIAWTEYGNMSSDLGFNPMTHQTFDAVWSMALALNRTDQQLRETYGRTLESFNYEDAQTKSLMVENLLQTDFIGPSGRVRFKPNHERLGYLSIMQYQSRQLGFVQVGLFDNGPGSEIIWLQERVFNTVDNKPPKGYQLDA